jgi:hypothetical protein
MLWTVMAEIAVAEATEDDALIATKADWRISRSEAQRAEP